MQRNSGQNNMKIKEVSERQLEIIEAAGKILTSEGVSGLTIKNLARQMGFTEAAVYRHFTSKEEIIVSMLGYLADSMDARYGGLPQGAGPEERFKALFHEQFRFFKKNPHFAVAVFSDGLMEESKRINETIARIMAVKMKHLVPVLRQGQANGIFTKAVPLENLLHIVMGAIRLQMFKWRVSNFQFDIKKAGDNMIESILILIKQK
ncbi:MAG TPA: TetR/AcrR family transcriptional regulator [Cyclobacteriaceae bacterium]|nr:TetR/AcrR family transcriptional regulator [Cyclobacteriaceae bacterium]